MNLSKKKVKQIEALTKCKFKGKYSNGYTFYGNKRYEYYADGKKAFFISKIELVINEDGIDYYEPEYQESYPVPIEWLRPLAKILEDKKQKRQTTKEKKIEKLKEVEKLLATGSITIPAHYESCHICGGKDMKCKSCGGSAPVYVKERVINLKEKHEAK